MQFKYALTNYFIVFYVRFYAFLYVKYFSEISFNFFFFFEILIKSKAKI